MSLLQCYGQIARQHAPGEGKPEVSGAVADVRGPFHKVHSNLCQCTESRESQTRTQEIDLALVPGRLAATHYREALVLSLV